MNRFLATVVSVVLSSSILFAIVMIMLYFVCLVIYHSVPAFVISSALSVGVVSLIFYYVVLGVRSNTSYEKLMERIINEYFNTSDQPHSVLRENFDNNYETFEMKVSPEFLTEEQKRSNKPITTKVSKLRDGPRVKFPRQRFAYAVARAAYKEFGVRVKDEANIKTTRRFILKYLKDFEDLRDVDAIHAIDVGLHLSFLPSRQWKTMATGIKTKVFVEASECEARLQNTLCGLLGERKLMDPLRDE